MINLIKIVVIHTTTSIFVSNISFSAFAFVKTLGVGAVIKFFWTTYGC
jgi:hypothetical protein